MWPRPWSSSLVEAVGVKRTRRGRSALSLSERRNSVKTAIQVSPRQRIEGGAPNDWLSEGLHGPAT
eukprot:15255999-Alexandrium_andersonii.AAC.1